MRANSFGSFSGAKQLTTRIGAVVAMLSMFISSPVFARTPIDGNITEVQVNNLVTNNPQLVITMAGVNYYAQPASAGCSVPNATIETLKMWQSMATSGYLAGKTVRIYFTPCNGFNWIDTIVLK